MKQFKVGDKVHIKGMPEDTFTIAEVFGSHFYALDEEEIAHLYLQEPNYENFYFIGDLILASI